jgi:uncharacterized membrane protein YhaH (DUF805 family)
MLSNARNVYKQSFKVSGRASRSEFWFFQLFYVLILLVLGMPIIGGYIPYYPLLIFVLLSIPAMFCIQVRRFHDLGKSGWWMLLNFIPYIGGFIVLVWCCFKGTIGPNEFDDESDRVPPSISGQS